jgi:TP53 regulating kinase-like protein
MKRGSDINQMKPLIITQGAEAIITLENNKINKNRISKSYRHFVIDEQIRKTRTKGEVKILTKSFELGVNVPEVLKSDKFNIEIEYIFGDKLSEKLNNYKEEKQFEVMELVGEQTAKLHENNIIHGDLTTSNMILKEGKVFIIDFGLGFFSSRIEDKAVDLHLIRQALEAKHYENYKELFKNFIKGYSWGDSDKVLEKLKIVEKRGRYKH